MAYPWWQSGVVYRISPRSFFDADGDGIGDLAGTAAKLDYVADLGVDAICLRCDAAAADPGGPGLCDLDPAIGSPADFDRLVNDAHARGLHVLMEIGPGTESTAPSWFVASREERDALLKAVALWMDRGVDGFRLHAGDCAPPPAGDLRDVPADVRRLLDGRRDGRVRVAWGDVRGFRPESWAAVSGPAGLHALDAGIQHAPFTAAGMRAHVQAVEDALPAGSWPVLAFGGPDRPRIATRYGPDATRLAAMLLLTLRGTPSLYYGDELGMPDTAVEPWKPSDAEGAESWESAANRTPMQWHGGPAAGFSTAAPWLPVGADADRRNVAVQDDEPGSLLNLYRRLLALRRATPALNRGGFRFADGGTDACLCYERTSEGGRHGRLFVALNFGSGAETVILPGGGRVLLWSHVPGDHPDLIETLRLEPGEGAVAVLY